jgi:hypothetical protein
MSLYEKLYNVMCDTEAIEKGLTVGSGNNSYKAIGEKEVLNMIKPLFKKYKLIIFPLEGEITEQNSVFDTTYKNEITTKTRNVTQLKVIYKIVDVESGESQTIVGFGNGADSQDKGSGKAFTYSFKTALSKTFMLFSGEDTDNTHSDDIGKPSNKTQTDAEKLIELASKHKITLKGLKATILQDYKKTTIESLTETEYEAIKTKIENKK